MQRTAACVDPAISCARFIPAGEMSGRPGGAAPPWWEEGERKSPSEQKEPLYAVERVCPGNGVAVEFIGENGN